jgi:hypothetical protein
MTQDERFKNSRPSEEEVSHLQKGRSDCVRKGVTEEQLGEKHDGLAAFSNSG